LVDWEIERFSGSRSGGWVWQESNKAATSMLLNIAEGYGRYHYLDSLRFYYTARGSLSETLSAFVACGEVGYRIQELPHQRELCQSALRSLNGFIRYVRGQQKGHMEYGDHIVREEYVDPDLSITVLEDD
jgi:four helix bundle protein